MLRISWSRTPPPAPSTVIRSSNFPLAVLAAFGAEPRAHVLAGLHLRGDRRERLQHGLGGIRHSGARRLLRLLHVLGRRGPVAAARADLQAALPRGRAQLHLDLV